MKILLLAHSFPPVGGGRGIAWANFLRFLHQNHGIEADVVTIQPLRGDPAIHEDRIRLIADETGVYRTFPGWIYSKLYMPECRGVAAFKVPPSSKRRTRIVLRRVYDTFIRPFFFPDRMVEWLPYAISKATSLIRGKTYDVLVTVGFPFSCHIAGWYLKRQFGIKWVADYGDPWSFNPSPETIPQWRRPLDGIVEKSILKEVDKVLVTTEETKAGFAERFSFLNGRIAVIPQGYDACSFRDRTPINTGGGKFRIVYTGTFYRNIRNPRHFFAGLSQVEYPDVEVLVAGMHTEEYLPKDERVRGLGTLSQEEVSLLQAEASVLLLLGNDSEYQLPGKIFEYAGARRPILAVKNSPKDLGAEFVREHNLGVIVNNEPEAIARAIEELYAMWKAGKLDKPFNLCGLPDFEWEAISDKLAALLKEI